ncbi:MAG TPA: DUF4097 family beta strand repeat-containing protein [Candidatus Krumholzibacteria bacterium]|nr:DUF4097 family beta strand repeat-containing protein [Candidatus Krumholzibacteria bacterium]HRX51369.1 DUF4097 family beta strand repeat-containing protein [Candidatus Krumholzibacteria bacterium]
MNRNATLAIATVLLLAAAPALAGRTPIDETRKVDGDAVVRVDNLAGSITVTGWDKNEVQIRGELDEKADELRIDGGGDHLDIEVVYPKKKNLNIREGSVLTLRVPHGCSLELQGVSSDVEVRDLRGTIQSSTVSGDVQIHGKPAAVKIASVSGEVTVEAESDEVSIESVSGRIEVRGARRSLEINLVSGDADVQAGELERLRFNAVSGDLDLRADPARNADWELDCHSGELTLELPGGLDADFDINLFSGDLHNDFGPKAERTSKFAPGKELRFTAGKGGARVEINTFSGDVRLVKR